MDFIEFAADLLENSIIYILVFVSMITLVLTVRALTLKRNKKTDALPDEGGTVQEIRPLQDEGISGQEIHPIPVESELKQEIRPLLDERTSESCEYCAIFKDLGTMVCPNCGRPLNLRLPEPEES